MAEKINGMRRTRGWLVVAALLLSGSAVAAPPDEWIKVAHYGEHGEWEIACHYDPDVECFAGSKKGVGELAPTVLVFLPAPRHVVVGFPGVSFVTAQVDDGPPYAAQCEGNCVFADAEFEAAWYRGKVLTVRIAAAGSKTPLAFTCDLATLRQALAAATAWMKKNPKPK